MNKLRKRDWIFLAIVVCTIWFGLMAQSGHSAEALNSVNQRRNYHKLYAFKYDAKLTERARRECLNLVKNGWQKHRSNHYLGVGGGATMAGTGVRSGKDPLGLRFNACRCVNKTAVYAGAWSMVSGNQTYHALMLSTKPVK